MDFAKVEEEKAALIKNGFISEINRYRSYSFDSNDICSNRDVSVITI